MRIISGKYKERKLYVPQVKDLRPTTDFARKGLFDILSNRITLEKINILDLFAGSGYVTFEFLSRNANSAIAIEKNKVLAGCIKRNAKILNAPVNVITGDVLKSIEHLTIKFDVIFCDPPFNYPNYNILINKIFEINLLTPKGILIVEHYKDKNFSTFPYFVHDRKYGKIHFSFFSECKEYF